MKTVEAAGDAAAVPVSTARDLRRGGRLLQRGTRIMARKRVFDALEDLTGGSARAAGSRPEGGTGCASA
jgi:hypothetical protein